MALTRRGAEAEARGRGAGPRPRGGAEGSGRGATTIQPRIDETPDIPPRPSFAGGIPIRTVVVVATLLALCSFPHAAAEEYRGTILVGHPLTQSSVQALNERLAPCDPDSPYNGLDSHWFDVSGAEGKQATLEMDITLDADAYFWTADCVFDGTFDCASQFQGTTERCIVPAGTRYVSVAGWTGTGAFVLTIE